MLKQFVSAQPVPGPKDLACRDSRAALGRRAGTVSGLRLFLTLFCLALLYPATAQAGPIGTVISLTPGVSALRGGQTIPLALKDAVEAGDTISTDGTGKVQIIFDDDSTVTLTNNTSLSMDEFRDQNDADPAFNGQCDRIASNVSGYAVICLTHEFAWRHVQFEE